MRTCLAYSVPILSLSTTTSAVPWYHYKSSYIYYIYIIYILYMYMHIYMYIYIYIYIFLYLLGYLHSEFFALKGKNLQTIVHGQDPLCFQKLLYQLILMLPSICCPVTAYPIFSSICHFSLWLVLHLAYLV